jgi:hypothetical protein
MGPKIARVGAEVGLDAHYRDPPLSLRVSGRLFVDTSDGRRLHATGGTVGLVFGGGRSADPVERVTRRDIEQSISSMVGRDTGRGAPPELAWQQFGEVLEQVAVTESQLIAAPFVIECSDELLAELDP